MVNQRAYQDMQRSYGVQINKLFWLAGQTENQDLWVFLENIKEEDWKELFPDIYDKKEFQEAHECISPNELRGLVKFKKLGYMAEILIPHCEGFVFKANSVPSMWTASSSLFHVDYVYAESSRELLKNIKRAAKKQFYKDVDKELKSIKNK
jgi:hypothetical protein